eukprot:comp18615_c0_seq1/m.20194 comp18615_c0_seq1/g.20194  ORF comp18615_c0_seq1/g.20194 comp18615_c0_seq1/m.20194 type:complete len:563 (-) comp18615_c0_seq1:175-1863(-)
MSSKRQAGGAASESRPLMQNSDAESGRRRESNVLQQGVRRESLQAPRSPAQGRPAYSQGPRKEDVAPVTEEKKKDGKMLAISFVAMVIIGLGNKVFNKLQTVPMHNYPFFLSIYSTFIYIPISFMYIFPMIKFGTLISKEEREIPQMKFFVMGMLDSICGLMQTFATNYLDGALVIMLTQVAIPISMVLSYFLMNARYNVCHILGANVVLAGLVVVLIPQFTDAKGLQPMDVIWIITLTLSCVPMTLSSIYKEKALGDQEIDPIYLNGWIAVWQFVACLVFVIPSAYATPGGDISTIPRMVINGFRCYGGINTDATDDCSSSPLLVNVYLFFNVGYNILIIMILKYGNANLLWLSSALMVPMGSMAFSLPFVPGHKPLGPFGYAGLVIIVFGLILYRFSHTFIAIFHRVTGVMPEGEELFPSLDTTQTTALLHNRGDMMDVTQYLFEGYTYSREKQMADLKRNPQTIRSEYLGRLGIRSPSYTSLAGSAPSSPNYMGSPSQYGAVITSGGMGGGVGGGVPRYVTYQHNTISGGGGGTGGVQQQQQQQGNRGGGGVTPASPRN